LNLYQRQKLSQVVDAQRRIALLLAPLSDILTSDRACGLLREAADELGRLEIRMRNGYDGVRR